MIIVVPVILSPFPHKHSNLDTHPAKLENRGVFTIFFGSTQKKMAEIDYELAHFFAWARARAYREFDARMKADPSLDPNWTFSDIMQELLDQYRQLQKENAEHAE